MIKTTLQKYALPFFSTSLLLLNAPAFSQQKLTADQLFNHDFIGADIAYLEYFIGPARVTLDNSKEYIVSGCRVHAYMVEGSIRALEMRLSPKCSFDLNAFLTSDNETHEPFEANTLKFGDLPSPTTYFSDCFGISCGNAYDPSVYEYYAGSRVEGFIEILASSTQASYEWTSQWAKAMADKEGEDWMMYGQYNCDPYKYNRVAEQYRTPDQIERVMVGYDLIQFKDLKQDCVTPF